MFYILLSIFYNSQYYLNFKVFKISNFFMRSLTLPIFNFLQIFLPFLGLYAPEIFARNNANTKSSSSHQISHAQSSHSNAFHYVVLCGWNSAVKAVCQRSKTARWCSGFSFQARGSGCQNC